MEQRKMLVGGDWVEAKSGEYYDNTNPANGELISRVPYGGAEDVDAAVAAAQSANKPKQPMENQPLRGAAGVLQLQMISISEF